jgi:hypothetical protein
MLRLIGVSIALLGFTRHGIPIGIGGGLMLTAAGGGLIAWKSKALRSRESNSQSHGSPPSHAQSQDV